MKCTECSKYIKKCDKCGDDFVVGDSVFCEAQKHICYLCGTKNKGYVVDDITEISEVKA